MYLISTILLELLLLVRLPFNAVIFANNFLSLTRAPSAIMFHKETK